MAYYNLVHLPQSQTNKCLQDRIYDRIEIVSDGLRQPVNENKLNDSVTITPKFTFRIFLGCTFGRSDNDSGS